MFLLLDIKIAKVDTRASLKWEREKEMERRLYKLNLYNMKKELKRYTQTIDADGKSPGRLATQVVWFLTGKGKASYVPNVDAGDIVQIIHASKMKILGKRLDQKKYFHHTTH